MTADTHERAKVSFHSLVGALKRGAKVRDPDCGNEEYDVWLASKCGRSSETITITGTYIKYSLMGVWQGKSCLDKCISIKYCRVGSVDVRTAGITSGPGIELVQPGEFLAIQDVHIK